MANLIVRLRARKTFGLNGANWVMLSESDPDCQEAADTIERLRAERDEWHARAFAMFWKLPGDLKVADLQAHAEQAKKFIESEAI